METINWGQLVSDADKSAEPPTLGQHVARIVKAEFKPTKDGDPMVRASWRILAGGDEGKVVRDNFVFTRANPNALHFQFGKLRALGIAPESLPQPGPAMAQVFMDKVATITIVQDREYNGIPQYSVSTYAAAPAGFGGVTAPPPVAAPPVAAPPAAAPQAVAPPVAATPPPVAAAPAPTVAAPPPPPPVAPVPVPQAAATETQPPAPAATEPAPVASQPEGIAPPPPPPARPF